MKPWLAEATAAAAQELKALGCDGTQFSCNGQGAYVELLGSRVAERLRAFDVWGNAYRVASSWSGLTLQSSGPDEVAQSRDDATFAFTFGDLGVQVPRRTGQKGASADADGGWVNAGAASAERERAARSAGDPTRSPAATTEAGRASGASSRRPSTSTRARSRAPTARPP